MCDCYTHKCYCCEEKIPMHLEDFNTAREEVVVFCHEHIPDLRKNGAVWEYWEEGRELEDSAPKRCFVLATTKTALDHAQGNHPNTGNSKIVEVFGLAVSNDDEEVRW